MNLLEPELTIIMPVFNESEILPTVLGSWTRVLNQLGIEYEFLIYNDESTDNTLQILIKCSKQIPALKIKSHENRGHGPTILRGYSEAQAKWVLQIDSDNEMPASYFHKLWNQRDNYDFLIGHRENRESSLSTSIITKISRIIVHLLFGSGVQDVNSPYRLMRREWLQKVVIQIPNTTLAPNIILSGLAIRHHLRMYECNVPYQNRKTGKVSLRNLMRWKFALKAFVQTLRLAKLFSKVINE